MLCLGDLAGPSELWVPTEAMEADFFSKYIEYKVSNDNQKDCSES